MQTIDEAQSLTQVVDQLATKFPRLDRSQISLAVDAEFHRHDGDPVRTYLPVLIERTLNQNLRLRANDQPLVKQASIDFALVHNLGGLEISDSGSAKSDEN